MRQWVRVWALCAQFAFGCGATPGTNTSNRSGATTTTLPPSGGGADPFGKSSQPATGNYGNATADAGPRMNTVRVSTDVDGSTACAAESQSAKTIPVDLYIMMDQSASMILPAGSGTRWSSITDALTTFVQRPEAAGVGVGIQYFGLGVSCDAADYAMPEVEIAPLPDNAQPISNSIAGHLPVAVTPTGPALDGAISHASQWQMAHPDHVVAVVLATDGEPDACGSSVDSVAQSAAMGLAAMPSIRSFVIGVGSGLQALDMIAQSGGTDHAFIVDDGQDTTQKLIDTLDKIRMTATLPCEYALPAPTGSMPVDFDKVNVNLTPSQGSAAGQPSVILRAPDMSRCDPQNGGWYYDNPSAPKSIKLCSASCSTVSQDPAAKLDILLGCQSRMVMVE